MLKCKSLIINEFKLVDIHQSFQDTTTRFIFPQGQWYQDFQDHMHG
jgi:hypothetical protein